MIFPPFQNIAIRMGFSVTFILYRMDFNKSNRDNSGNPQKNFVEAAGTTAGPGSVLTGAAGEGYTVENRIQQSVPLPSGARGKRETGAKPVRSRHCMRKSSSCAAGAATGRPGRRWAKGREPGNLPSVGTGKVVFSRSRGIDRVPCSPWGALYTQSLCQTVKSFFRAVSLLM